MEKQIEIRHGKEHFPNYVWWKAPFEWQRRLNGYLTCGFPLLLKSNEENWLLSFQQELQKFFCEAFNNRQVLTPFFFGSRPEPYIDILENNSGYIVNADVPGVSMENLHLRFTDDALIIRGKRDACKAYGGHLVHKECCHDHFERVIALPENADLKNSHAEFNHNVLAVKIPKKGIASAKKKPVANDYSPRKEAS